MKLSGKSWLRRAAEQDTWTRSKRGCRRQRRLTTKLTERGSRNSGTRRRGKRKKEMASQLIRIKLATTIRTFQQVELNFRQPVAVIRI